MSIKVRRLGTKAGVVAFLAGAALLFQAAAASASVVIQSAGTPGPVYTGWAYGNYDALCSYGVSLGVTITGPTVYAANRTAGVNDQQYVRIGGGLIDGSTYKLIGTGSWTNWYLASETSPVRFGSLGLMMTPRLIGESVIPVIEVQWWWNGRVTGGEVVALDHEGHVGSPGLDTYSDC